NPRAGDPSGKLPARLVAEVRELERHAEVAFAERRDHCLQVVALLAGHPQLIALGLALDPLQSELLDELVELTGLVGRDACVQLEALADGGARGFLDLALLG